jgi:hypothetical protein
MPQRVLVVALVLVLPLVPGEAAPVRMKLASERGLDLPVKGKVLDLTANHGQDNRIWSAALGQKRSLYIYLPPGYCPCKQYPVMIWLHALAQDERGFLDDVLPFLDAAIVAGTLPPLIVAAPDGTISGEARVLRNGSFFINSPRGGNFEDYLLQDVWGLLQANFLIRPEPQAHVMAGISMGGFGAFNKVLKYPDTFGVALGIFPPLHLRYADCRGRVMANFNPDCQGVREDFSNPRTIIGRFFHFLKVRQPDLIAPLFDPADPSTRDRIIAENPYDLLNPCRHGGGKVALWAGYGAKDQFNIDAHIEAFQYRARELGIPITTVRLPHGNHLRPTALKLFPDGLRWLDQQLANYGPR